jgi:hypothetical protein
VIPPIPILEAIEAQHPAWPALVQAAPPLFAHVDTRPGADEPLRIGDRATVTFRVGDGKSKEVADTDRRGLTFTFVIGEGKERLLELVVAGMRVGGERAAKFSPVDVYGKSLMPTVIPDAQTLEVRVRVLSAIRRPAPPAGGPPNPPEAQKGQR